MPAGQRAAVLGHSGPPMRRDAEVTGVPLGTQRGAERHHRERALERAIRNDEDTHGLRGTRRDGNVQPTDAGETGEDLLSGSVGSKDCASMEPPNATSEQSSSDGFTPPFRGKLGLGWRAL